MDIHNSRDNTRMRSKSAKTPNQATLNGEQSIARKMHFNASYRKY